MLVSALTIEPQVNSIELSSAVCIQLYRWCITFAFLGSQALSSLIELRHPLYPFLSPSQRKTIPIKRRGKHARRQYAYIAPREDIKVSNWFHPSPSLLFFFPISFTLYTYKHVYIYRYSSTVNSREFVCT